MSFPDDDRGVLLPETTDRLLAGDPVAGEPGLTALVATLRSYGNHPSPPPGLALQSLMDESTRPRALSPTLTPAIVHPGRRAWKTRAAAAGLAAKLSIGLGATAAAAAGLGGADALPEPAQHVFDDMVETLTGVDRPAPAAPEPGSGAAPAEGDLPSSPASDVGQQQDRGPVPSAPAPRATFGADTPGTGSSAQQTAPAPGPLAPGPAGGEPPATRPVLPEPAQERPTPTEPSRRPAAPEMAPAVPPPAQGAVAPHEPASGAQAEPTPVPHRDVAEHNAQPEQEGAGADPYPWSLVRR